ncbi:2-amino-4-hydroxy-6-hydroxymethyldihydropteridine diphosphokinase [Allorhodopirellula heiligendammensis]|uniref:2-amino-4-hydroxy-6-hydroxymethyldihydropteridine pyrophosphokinase n=1 Tax=Allorhodopirellula heiligendammensis TaxID=2714739 RepID=A0A5C6BXA9_9BACT|nr:2-amino-4-hydroxy-6-hydroxymethyldihydropteridine diphosphokinase [Allorhodopirellula heiligendammensis]TWU16595.1 2-amino-4-hydroxy-6-hydroxymethyldihydropteridine pyrophosphokinase [Allorhodopirellula heiligendammensis]
MPTHCLISFGSNLGDRDAVVAHAARLVDRSGIVAHRPDCETASPAAGLRTSRLFETPPIGGPGGQSPFLNAVAAFATDASASEVLDVLQQAEQELGRKRENRWGARSIDLDVVLHGQLCGDAPAGRRGLIGGRGPVGGPNSLVVPHPRYTARKFVVVPACDVAADYRDPRFGWTLADLATHLACGPPSMALTGGDEALRRTICERLANEHDIQIIDADARSTDPASSDAPLDGTRPWVSPSVPQSLREQLPEREHASLAEAGNLPRLIARIERTTEATRWPAPHQIWPLGWRWPEYRLEVDDLDWAVGEMASALDSMCCDVRAITPDGDWWYA